MASYDLTQSNTAHAAGIPRVHSWLGAVIEPILAWNNARRTRAALSRLSDHELEDIGIVRADIEKIARRG